MKRLVCGIEIDVIRTYGGGMPSHVTMRKCGSDNGTSWLTPTELDTLIATLQEARAEVAKPYDSYQPDTSSTAS